MLITHLKPHTSMHYGYNCLYVVLNTRIITFIVHHLRLEKENQIYRRSKEIEQEMVHKNTHTQTKQQEHVTLSSKLQSTALTLNFLVASTA